MRALRRQARRVIFAAINGHQTYARTGPSDAGRTITDEFGQCKCLACIIARAADIGYAECMHQRHRASRRQMTVQKSTHARIEEHLASKTKERP